MENSLELDAMVSPRLKEISARRAAVETRVVNALGGAIEATSWQGCRVLGSYLGLAFFAAGKRRRELAIGNVQMALGLNRAQANRVARRSAQNWGMTTCEFLHLPAATGSEIRNYVRLDGLEQLQNALAQGKGAIVMTAHIGNWELLAARLAVEVPLDAMARPLSNPTAQEKMSSVRRGTGMTLISKHGAARPVMKGLQRNRAVLILPDRHAGPEGVALPLFGKVTRFEGTMGRFAVMSGAPIVPAFGFRRAPWLQDGRIDAQIWPAFEVHSPSKAGRDAAALEGTRRVISSLENAVRMHPDQWSWMLRRWRDDDSS
ncbi:MAG TPA: lysophospholipid acyltransferase family protein [Abditibacterium sp.]|jgi:KDO2-lipid IV(A) lauroyltransferase